eukprot:GCRY01003225.1.p1 GENE.GCRY01003225.1~~GCRY01003225.1.p1  ORF type:complete len:257 (+),score=41.67 GCRY01003225.1:95-772(+)
MDAASQNALSALEGKFDQEQLELMKEECIQLNDKDEVIGAVSKVNSHLGEGILHRAFSVFLFNSKGELCLQQRSGDKITFPLYWTNTCCSHPLYRETELNGEKGVKNAAVRKLDHELGITAILPEDLKFLTRMSYFAKSDSKWCEREIDYILLCQKDVECKIVPNEVAAVQYVSQEKLKEMLASESEDLKITPWFKLICHNFLFKWWDNLSELMTLPSDNIIHRL